MGFVNMLVKNMSDIYNKAIYIDYNRFALFNGLIDSNIGEYLSFNEKESEIEIYHVNIKRNSELLPNSIMVIKKDILENRDPVAKMKVDNIKEYIDSSIMRIALNFIINEFSVLGISPQFIHDNHRAIITGDVNKIKNLNPLNSNYPEFYLKQIERCRDMECIYKIFKKEKENIEYSKKNLL